MKDPLDFLYNEPEPDIFFSDIEPSPDHEYTILIKDIGDYKVKNLATDRKYVVFRVKLIEGFEGFENTLMYKFNVPFAAFKYAWNIAPNFRRLKKGEPVDVILTFKRITQKKLRIIRREYLGLKKQGVTFEEQ